MKPSAAFLIASQIVSTGLKFAIFVLLASYGGMGVAGSYTLGLAVVSPIFLFFNLGLREIYVTEKTTGLSFQSVLLLRAFYGAVAVLISTVIGVFVFAEHGYLIFWMSIFRYSEALLGIVIAYFQRRSHPVGMASVSIAFSVPTYVALGLTYICVEELTLAVVAAGGVGVVVFVISLFVSRPWQAGAPTIPSRAQLGESLRHGVMLSLSSFAVSFATNTPILFLEIFHSSVEVGFYSAIYHITTISNILYSSIAQLELRGFAVAIHEQEYKRFVSRWRKVNGVLSLIGLIGALALAIVGLPSFELLFGQDFSSVYPAIILMGLVICLTPSGFLLDGQMIALRQFASQSLVSICGLIVTVALSLLLIPSYAVVGGVMVVLLNLIFRNGFKYFLVKRETASRISRVEVKLAKD